MAELWRIEKSKNISISLLIHSATQRLPQITNFNRYKALHDFTVAFKFRGWKNLLGHLTHSPSQFRIAPSGILHGFPQNGKLVKDVRCH